MYTLKNSFHTQFEEEVFQGWSKAGLYATDAEKYIFKKHLSTDVNTLEAGTGGGRISFYLEDALNFKNIIAFDLVPKLIEHCKSVAIKKGSNIKFEVADVSNLKRYKSREFGNLLYTGQVLSMVPKAMLNNALLEAYNIGDKESTYVFSFMDWNARWYNPVLSFMVNLSRLLKFKKIETYYIPEIRHMKRINKHFFSAKGYGILWIKKKHAIKKLESSGFNIKAAYRESELSNSKSVLFFICTQKDV
jgi:hypothetical protein